jgi:hypothetical protein
MATSDPYWQRIQGRGVRPLITRPHGIVLSGSLDLHLTSDNRKKANGNAQSDAVYVARVKDHRTQGHERSAFEERQKVFRNDLPTFA